MRFTVWLPHRGHSLFNERVTNAAAGGGGGEGGGVGGKEGGREEESVISQTSVVNHFTPLWICAARMRLPSTADRERREAGHGARRQQVSDDVQYATAAPANKLGD
ncbi:hypothetical protein AMECASPLE_003672 [Ameca splendens]|uniref:Uncharacterized protein n=1 Tax=Ameca splendens TaxID=208324 RepID=A0ABV0Z7G5_9TELE